MNTASQMKYLYLFFFLFFAAGLSAQSVQQLELQLRDAKTASERMGLRYQIATLLINKDRDKAEKLAKAAFQTAQDKRNLGMQTQTSFLLGRIYEKKRNDRNAKVWFESALKYAKQAKDVDYIVKSVEKISDLYVKERKFRDAYNVAADAFKYFSTNGQSLSEMRSNYDVQKARLSREERELLKQKEQLEKQISVLERDRSKLSKNNSALSRKTKELEDENVQIQEEKTLIEEEKQKIEALVDEQEDEINKMSAAQLQSELKNEKLARLTAEREKEVQLAEMQLQEAELENERNLLFTYGLAGLAGLLVLTAISLFVGFRSKQKAAKELAEKNRLIEEERERSEELLLNTLPKDIAQELKVNGQVQAKKFNDATVLFTDFKNFTSIAEKLTPEQLVEELDNCFKAFDFIISQYDDIEKIKTIGDAYMAASGLSVRKTLPTNLIKAALEMQEFLDEVKQERRAKGLPFFEARIGLHTGPVVAGVVGVKKFAYDIWGDTVNIAARMEANCEPGKVNISETTHKLVQYKFKSEHRGKIMAKNKGEVDMYYVQ